MNVVIVYLVYLMDIDSVPGGLWCQTSPNNFGCENACSEPPLTFPITVLNPKADYLFYCCIEGERLSCLGPFSKNVQPMPKAVPVTVVILVDWVDI